MRHAPAAPAADGKGLKKTVFCHRNSLSPEFLVDNGQESFFLLDSST